MSGLFSQINLLLCIVQGIDGLLTKTLKKASIFIQLQNSPIRAAGSDF